MNPEDYVMNWQGKVTLTISENELEMILNALSYEHHNNVHLTQDYRDALEALYESFDNLPLD